MRHQKQKTVPLAVIAMLLLFLASACSVTQTNIGKTALPRQRITITGEKADSGMWQTNDIAVIYSLSATNTSLSLSGSVHFEEYILASFPLTRFFNLYLNLLDENGKVLQTHDMRPHLSYRANIPESINISKTISRPPGTTAIAFSYWGMFSGANRDEDTGEWEIYFNPFEKPAR